MTDYRGETFRDVEVDIDDCRFFECTFERVVFNYSGKVFTFEGCNFITFPLFNLQGDLGRGLSALAEFGHSAGPKGVKRMVDTLSACLRRSKPKETFTIG